MATIYDVARHAGVSPKTVSRVLNGQALVSPQTRAAVTEAMMALDYIPSKAARTMRSRRSGLIGMITGAISAAPSEPAGLPSIYIVRGAQALLAEHGLTMLIADTGGDDLQVPKLIETFITHQVEGLIHVAEYHQETRLPPVARSLSRRTPVVLANCFDRAGAPAIVPDDENGAYDLVNGLIQRGHTRIGFLTLPDDHVAHGLRLKGYRRALVANGIAFDPDLIAEGASSNPAEEYLRLPHALDGLLRQDRRPTAICCGNDKMAMRVYPLLADRGLAVPGDISVAGYDNYRLITENLSPPLTTVDLSYEAMGRRAAKRLVDLLDSETPETEASPPQPDLVAGDVVWRQSVAARRVNFNTTVQNQ